MSGTPAGIWLRVSTAEQAEGDSLDHHEHRAREYAATHGFEVVEVYRLEGVSGAVSLEHPLARKLRRDVRAGRIRVLLTAKMARLSRDGLASRLLLRLFEEAGARIVFLDDGLDSGNPQTRFLLQQLADFAELERTEIAGRIRASLKTRIALGKPLGGKAPYGYRRVEGRLEPDPATAPIRRLIFELYAEHRAFVTVARELERRGIPPPAGRRWSDMSVKWLLSDPVVIGQHRYNYVARGGPDGRQTYKPAAEMRLEPVPPIVPAALWEEVQALWKKQRARRTPRGVRYPFSGLTYCPCGDRIYPRAKPRRFICYRCGVTVEADTVEEAFVRRLATLPVPEDPGDPGPGDLAGALADLTLEIQALELQERELTGKIRRAVESLADPAVRAETVRPWEERLRALRQNLPARRERLAALQREALEGPPGTPGFRTLADVWATAPVPERKRLAQALVERVTVLPGRELKFAWKITPGPAGGT